MDTRRELKFFTIFGMLLLSLLKTNIAGQSVITELNSKNGLSQNSGYEICQDENGIIWIATQTGLDAYDGNHFWHYGYRQLGWGYNNETTCFYENNKDGILWVGTGNGLGLINTKNYLHARIKESKGWNIRDISTVQSSSNKDELILATKEGLRIIRVQIKGKDTLVDSELIRTNLKIDNGFHSIVPLKKGYFVGSTKELFRLNFEDTSDEFGNIQPIRLENETSPIKKIYRLKETGQILVSSKTQVHQFDPNGQLINSFPYLSNVNSFCIKDSNLLMGTEDNSILVLNEQGNPQKYNTRFPDQIRSLQLGRDGELWIGTHGEGVFVESSLKQMFKHAYAPDPGDLSPGSDHYVFSILPDESNIQNVWIGTLGAGLIKLNYEKDSTLNTIQFAKSIRDTSEGRKAVIRSIVANIERDSLFVATSVGLFQISKDQPRDWETSPITDMSVNWIYLNEPSKQLFMGMAEGGAFVKNTAKRSRIDEILFESIIKPEVIFIGQGRGSEILLGTEQGIFTLENPWNRNAIRNPMFSMLEDQRISCIYFFNSTYWVATQGGGLYSVDLNGGLRHYSQQDGLVDDVIYGFLPDKNGTFWLSTNLGLIRFYPELNVFIPYDVEDGLQDIEFNSGAFAAANNRLFFGGIKGINYFDPLAYSSKDFRSPKIGFSYENPHITSNGKLSSPLTFSTETNHVLDYDFIELFFWVSIPNFADPGKSAIRIEICEQGKCQQLIKHENIFAIPRSVIPKSNWWWKSSIIKIYSSNLSGEFNKNPTRINLKVKPPLILNIPIPAWIIGALFLLFLSLVAAVLIRRNTFLNRIKLLRVVGAQLSKASTRIEIKEIVKHYIGKKAEHVLNSHVFGFGVREEDRINMFAVWEKGIDVDGLIYDLDDYQKPAIWCWNKEEEIFDHRRGEIFTNQVPELYRRMNEKRPSEDEVQGKRAGSLIYRNLELGSGNNREQIGVITIQNRYPNRYKPASYPPMVKLITSPRVLFQFLMAKLDRQAFGETMNESDLLNDLSNSLANALARVEKSKEVKKFEIEHESLAIVGEQFRSAMTSHFVGNTIDEIGTMLDGLETTKLDLQKYLQSLSGLYKSFADQSEPTISIRDEYNLLYRYFHVRESIYLKDYCYRLSSNLQPYFKKAANYLKYTDKEFDPIAKKEIPQMLVQPFLENSLKYAHGNRPGNEIEVRVNFRKLEQKEGKFLIISIADNGVGILDQQPTQKKDGKASRSLKNLARRLALINRSHNYENGQAIATYTIVDFGSLSKSELSQMNPEDLPTFIGPPTGCMVKISLPWSYEF